MQYHFLDRRQNQNASHSHITRFPSKENIWNENKVLVTFSVLSKFLEDERLGTLGKTGTSS